MSEDALRSVVLSVLSQIAPEIEDTELEPDVDLREQIDIDSMDFLNFIVGVHEETGIDIPESDYPKLATIDNCVAYLSAHLREEALGKS